MTRFSRIQPKLRLTGWPSVCFGVASRPCGFVRQGLDMALLYRPAIEVAGQQ
jgi:hypothetical protein